MCNKDESVEAHCLMIVFKIQDPSMLLSCNFLRPDLNLRDIMKMLRKIEQRYVLYF